MEAVYTTEFGNETAESQQEFDKESQQAARNAVMEIPLFPDLTVALRKAIGDGPHVDMLQHLVYWFHPRHKSTQKRWSIWKTYKEWYEECGLKRRRVDNGRRKLKALGLVTEKHGPYKRVYYKVDWVALAEVLECTEVYSQSLYAGVQSNTEEYTQESTLEATALEAVASKPKEIFKEKEEESLTAAVPTHEAPPHPGNEELVERVRETLDPFSGAPWAARHLFESLLRFDPETTTRNLKLDSQLTYAGVADEELLPVVHWVLWGLTRKEAGQLEREGA